MMKRSMLAAVLLVAGCAAPTTSTTAPVPCTPAPPPEAPATEPTAESTLRQAYGCVLERYYGAAELDHRRLLWSAFAAFTQELQRRGIDQGIAAMPALTGDRDRDWAAFAAVYRQVDAGPRERQALAEAVMRGLLDALDDNHATWVRDGAMVPAGAAIGVTGLSGMQGLHADPAATAPLFITSVAGNGPAAKAGVRPGDVIESVNGLAPFTGGVLSQYVVDRLNGPDGEPVRLKVARPSNGREWTVSLAPAEPSMASAAQAGRLRGDLAYVSLPGFHQDAADQVVQAITRLREQGALRGVVLDLRENLGGSPEEVNRLLGAFAHGKVTGHLCDGEGRCEASRTDDSVPLLNLPLAVLTDRTCASACDAFSAAVKALRIGDLVGARTAGAVSGPALSHVLDDGSVLLLPAQRHLGPGKEMIDTIGVTPHHQVPVTAGDLSHGRDPALDKAQALLR